MIHNINLNKIRISGGGRQRDSQMGLLVQTTTFLPLLWCTNAEFKQELANQRPLLCLMDRQKSSLYLYTLLQNKRGRWFRTPPEIVKWGFWRKLPLFYHFCGAPTQMMKISDFPIHPFTNDLLPSSLYNLVFMKGPNCVP